MREANRLGVHVVQIADNLPVDHLSATELDQLAAFAHDMDVTIEVGTRGIAPALLLRYLRVALALGSPIVRTLSRYAHAQARRR